MALFQLHKKKVNTNELKLIEFTINYGLDLWILKELFIKYKYNYSFYNEHWKEVSKIHMTKQEYERAVDSMKRYLKEHERN